ncbi:MAG: polysaccharide biosynthesis/export family protein [Syntrophales bacterium]|nr:polysaccharide biosynthesis/export family protein [Syntrophales bacterium]MDD5641389.1 polysaccharide biosynthesis/export family protein [Syntrophales bacterium]
MKTYRLLSVVLVLLLLPLAACGPGGKGTGVRQVAFPEMKPPTPGPIKAAEPYRVMKGDTLSVTFPLNRELNVTSVLVRPDGKIDLNLIGDVLVCGLTIPEVQEAISKKYKEFIAKTGYSRVLMGGDYFDLKFVYNPELNIGVRIGSDGNINLPMVGVVHAAGLSVEGLREKLIEAYSQDIVQPDIAVLIGVNPDAQPYNVATKKIHDNKEFINVALVKPAGQLVFVGGEVKAAKAVPWEGYLTVLQAIVAAGGKTDEADLSRVVVLRRGPFEQTEWLLTDLASPPEGKSLKNDVNLKAGDIVLVPKSGIAKLNLWVKQYIRDTLPIQTQGAVGAYWQSQFGTFIP